MLAGFLNQSTALNTQDDSWNCPRLGLNWGAWRWASHWWQRGWNSRHGRRGWCCCGGWRAGVVMMTRRLRWSMMRKYSEAKLSIRSTGSKLATVGKRERQDWEDADLTLLQSWFSGFLFGVFFKMSFLSIFRVIFHWTMMMEERMSDGIKPNKHEFRISKSCKTSTFRLFKRWVMDIAG